MCANPDKATTDQFRARKTRQRAYKIVSKGSGVTEFYSMQYEPGLNVDPHRTRTLAGYLRTNHGLHCFFTSKAAANFFQGSSYYTNKYTVVAVTYDPCDVIAVESPWRRRSYCQRQLVVRALHISERAWKQAGLPARRKDGER